MQETFLRAYCAIGAFRGDRALATLPEDLRVLVVLRDLHCLEYEDITSLDGPQSAASWGLSASWQSW